MIPASNSLIEVNSLSRDEQYLYIIIGELMEKLDIKTMQLKPHDIDRLRWKHQFYQLDENAAWGISLTQLIPDEHSKFLWHLPEKYLPMELQDKQVTDEDMRK